MPTSTPVATERSLQLPCPHCGEGKANIDLHLVDFSFTCQECNADFTAADVREFIEKWGRVLSWLDTAPAA